MPLSEFRADLHIHTCLSPCADKTMLPTAIIQQAKLRGLDIIGICDHNSAQNVSAVKKAGKREGVGVLGGIEITSREEVHIMGFFEDDDNLEKMQEAIYENLAGENKEDIFGEQLIADEDDKIVGFNPKLLIGAANFSVDEIVGLVHRLDGMVIASHIDREAFGIIGQLGFVPEGLALDAVEVSVNCPSSEIANYKEYGFAVVRFSDAHFLSDIGKSYASCLLNEPILAEFAMALKGAEGRKVKFLI